MFYENYTEAEQSYELLQEKCPLFANFMGSVLSRV